MMLCATLVVKLQVCIGDYEFDGLGTVFLEICRYTESGVKIIEKHRFLSSKVKQVLDF